MNIETLRDLATRLDRATGPDRELDAAIAITIAGFVYERRGNDRKEWFYDRDGRRRQLRTAGYDRLPAWTVSLDAVAALHERLLPGWVLDELAEYSGEDKRRWYARILHPTDYTTPVVCGQSGPTECLARLRAIVAALIAIQQEEI